VSLDHLWAGWRNNYVASVIGEEPAGDEEVPDDEEHCVFCRIIASGESDEIRHVVFEDERVVAMLNAYPYATGHLLVMPRRHLRHPADLDGAESEALWRTTVQAITAIERAYGPEGMNLGANLGRAAGAGIPRHLHLHVVPRWVGDTNFMTATAAVRVLPEALPDTWAKLRTAWSL
jgi:diadenosine tetraphosphate (Ap4A) HIT family hydrolase